MVDAGSFGSAQVVSVPSKQTTQRCGELPAAASGAAPREHVHVAVTNQVYHRWLLRILDCVRACRPQGPCLPGASGGCSSQRRSVHVCGPEHDGLRWQHHGSPIWVKKGSGDHRVAKDDKSGPAHHSEIGIL